MDKFNYWILYTLFDYEDRDMGIVRADQQIGTSPEGAIANYEATNPHTRVIAALPVK